MNFFHSFCFMLLCATLAVYEVFLLNQPLSMATPVLIFFLFVPFLSSGNKLALLILEILGVLWCFGSFFVSLNTQRIGLGVFTLFLSGYWFFLSLSLRSALSRSFVDSLMQWYQGTPQPIWALQCELRTADPPLLLSVSRLDQEGTFIFSSLKQAIPLNKKKVSEMIFRFKNKEVHCKGKPTRFLKARRGIGFRFTDMTVDGKKKLGDFVEGLRGEGYVP